MFPKPANTPRFANMTAWNVMYSPFPSSPYYNVSLLIAPANGKCKPEGTANNASDGLCGVADDTLSARFSDRMWIPLNHKNNIYYLIFKSVALNNAVNMNAPPLILTYEVEGNEAGEHWGVS